MFSPCKPLLFPLQVPFIQASQTRRRDGPCMISVTVDFSCFFFTVLKDKTNIVSIDVHVRVGLGVAESHAMNSTGHTDSTMTTCLTWHTMLPMCPGP